MGCAHRPRIDWSHHAYTELEQPTEPAAVAPETVLSPEAVNEELSLTMYVLERGYGGRAFVPAKAWSAMQQQLEQLQGQSMTVQQLCDRIDDAFWELPDAHLSAKRQSLPERQNMRCGPKRTAADRQGHVGKNRGAELTTAPWRYEEVAAGPRNVAVISITKLPFHEDPVWRGFTDAVAQALRADAVMVDLRGNGGGDDTQGSALANALADADVPWDAERVHDRLTVETLTLQLNWLLQQRVAHPEVEPRIAEISTARTAALKRSASEPEYRIRPQPGPAFTPGPKAFVGKVAILVDGDCGSSCESSLESLRKAPHAKVFGERTGGYINFGNLSRFTLPHSGIRLGLPSKYNEYPGGAIYDKVGYAPDVEVKAGSDAFDAALAWVTEP